MADELKRIIVRPRQVDYDIVSEYYKLVDFSVLIRDWVSKEADRILLEGRNNDNSTRDS